MTYSRPLFGPSDGSEILARSRTKQICQEEIMPGFLFLLRAFPWDSLVPDSIAAMVKPAAPEHNAQYLH
ncbi:hypothetical protein STEG23_006413 [Scotinomys teguina]